MLLSETIADRLVKESNLAREDTVLEIGTGTGVITKLLATCAGEVITWEIDPAVFQSTSRALARFRNVEMRCGDAFSSENNVKFDICVTSLPYSESLRFVKWLSSKAAVFKRCVAIVQSEFAEKLASEAGKKSYRAVSVLCQNSFKIERLFPIASQDFDPQPRVQSESIRLTPRRDIAQPFYSARRMYLLNHLFSFRGRLLSSAVKKTQHSDLLPEHLLNVRIENLTPDAFAEIITRLEVSS